MLFSDSMQVIRLLLSQQHAWQVHAVTKLMTILVQLSCASTLSCIVCVKNLPFLPDTLLNAPDLTWQGAAAELVEVHRSEAKSSHSLSAALEQPCPTLLDPQWETDRHCALLTYCITCTLKSAGYAGSKGAGKGTPLSWLVPAEPQCILQQQCPAPLAGTSSHPAWPSGAHSQCRSGCRGDPMCGPPPAGCCADTVLPDPHRPAGQGASAAGGLGPAPEPCQ